ncbi:MAG: UDP-N-acetylglucosamine 1-carboxyvinyltransferase [Candidatus Spechtbacterales bacterium]|nr:UDP-N-acetylglucosamine 1-carboxyvinyltransferase [Candidatus Spechtbacterales bacterium]
MTESFRIRGGNTLEGDTFVQGSKNAATKLIAATLLTSDTCRLKNVPKIRDVQVMLEILEEMGAQVKIGDNIVEIKNSSIDPSKLPYEKVIKLRSSVVLIGPMLARFGEVKMPYPGGDKIGARSLDTHFNIFLDLGYEVKAGESLFSIKKTSRVPAIRKIILDEFSVTATENFLMACSRMPHQIEASIVAQEPHIQNLSEFLNKMGANVQILPGNVIRIKGSQRLHGAEIDVVRDYIEAGTFVIAGLLSGRTLRVHNFPVNHLELFLQKLIRGGALIKIEDPQTVTIKGSTNIVLPKIQTMIYPGVPTDLQSPIGILATQTPGITIIHDPLYEGRLKYLRELQKMGAQVKIKDVHRAEVYGPTKLKGATIKGEDIRGGMALIIAGLIAEGDTILENTYQVDRGYEKIDERLRSLGADIKRI